MRQRHWSISKPGHPWVCVAGPERAAWTNLGPLPNGHQGQSCLRLAVHRVCASFLAHLLICGEWPRGGSSSNLWFQTRCLWRQCVATQLLGRVLAHNMGPAGWAAAVAARTAGRQVSGNPTWIRRQPIGSWEASKYNISAEIKRTRCCDLSKHLPACFHSVISECRFWGRRDLGEIDQGQKFMEEGSQAKEASKFFPRFPEVIRVNWPSDYLGHNTTYLGIPLNFMQRFSCQHFHRVSVWS